MVSYAGLKFALDCGINVWDYAETYTLQAVIRDYGSPSTEATAEGRGYRRAVDDRNNVSWRVVHADWARLTRCTSPFEMQCTVILQVLRANQYMP
jgi:hypothetical protein